MPWLISSLTCDSSCFQLDFLDKFPEYKGRDFYITGESYGGICPEDSSDFLGIYLPTLGEKLVADKINFPNFKVINRLKGNKRRDFREWQ